MKNIEFKIIGDGTPADFQKKVNENLSNGWQLLGNFIVKNGYYEVGLTRKIGITRYRLLSKPSLKQLQYSINLNVKNGCDLISENIVWDLEESTCSVIIKKTYEK